MNPLSHEEFIELGVSIPSDTLVQWASGQLAATKGKETRLEARGMNEVNLGAIRDLAALVERRGKELGETQDLPPEAVARAQRLREEALGYWREAKLIAKVEFGTRPDLLSKFRTGVQTGLLLANLTKEMESVVALLREHAAQLAGLGGTDAFIARGTALVGKLKDAKSELDAACRALPAAAVQQCHDKGLLYDRTRKLVRTGRLEFLRDPEQASEFNFTGIRKEQGTSTRPRVRPSKESGR
jgi:hypothetical protein